MVEIISDNSTLWKEDQYIDELEKIGIDTVCFMGSGYGIEDVRVGSEFYFTYAFLARRAVHSKIGIEEILIANRGWYILFDKYRIISKYRYKESKITGLKYRDDFVRIKNMRTKEIHNPNWDVIDNLFYCLFITT